MSGKQETGLNAIRFSRLDAAGLPQDNTGGSPAGAWVACDPIKTELAFEYDQGTETIQKDGKGNLCFTRKRPNNLKSATVKFEVCGGDPRMLELILSGPGVVMGGGTPTGFGLQNAACSAPTRNGIFVEWWTENYNCNATDSSVPFSRHFTPRVVADYDGGTWDEGKHAFAFTGVCNAGVVNPTAQDAGGGPFNDLINFPADEAFLYGFQSIAAEADTLEALSCAVAYTTLPAQTV
jgi:hypothetical protein